MFVLGLLLIVITGVPVVTFVVHMRNKLNRQQATLSRKQKAGRAVPDDAVQQLNQVRKSAVTLPLIAVLLAVSGIATCHAVNESERSTYRNARSHWVSGNGAKDGMCAVVGGQVVCHLGEGGLKFGLLMFCAAAVLMAVPLMRQRVLNRQMRAESIVGENAAKNKAKVLSPPQIKYAHSRARGWGWTNEAPHAGGKLFFESLGEEIGPELCRQNGCERKRIALSVMCRAHHYEMVFKHPCPYR